MAALEIQEFICTLFKLNDVVGIGSCGGLPMEKLLVEYLLVPSVLILIFIWFATNQFLHGLDTKFSSILAIVFYIAIIYSGLYAVIAPIGYNLIIIFLIVSFAVFILSRFFDTRKFLDNSKAIGEAVTSLKDAKGGNTKKKIKKLEKAIEEVDKKINEEQKKLNNAQGDLDKDGIMDEIRKLNNEKNYYMRQIRQLRVND
jgi:hypothetical protein